jgi:uncharacterized protein involved in exopolysaccharide biosynthesis
MEAIPPAVSAVETQDASVAEVASTFWRRRWTLAVGAVIGAVVAVLPTFFRPSTYSSVATVIPSNTQQGGDARLRGLASQFGLGNVPLGSGSSAASPEFIIRVASSMEVRRRLLADTLESPEVGGRRALLDVIAPAEEGAETPRDRERRVRRGMRRLDRWVSMETSDRLGVVDVQVSTPWPTVSLAVAQRLLTELNTYNLELARESARDERRFAQERIAERDRRLRAAEARLAEFLRSNRQYGTSPNLMFEHERLQREVDLHQQVLINLIQSSEEAQLRELRDTPTLQVLEPPVLAPDRDPSGRAIAGLFGLVVGTVVAALYVLLGGRAPGAGRRGRPADADRARVAG